VIRFVELKCIQQIFSHIKQLLLRKCLSNYAGYPQSQQPTASLQSYPVEPPGSQPIQHIPPTQHIPPPASDPSQQLPYPASVPVQQSADDTADLQSAPPDYAAGNSIIISSSS